MKTTKKLVIMLLVFVLGVAVFIPSTYSWYDHNGELTGNRMGYTRQNLPVSGGSLSMTTKKYRMDDNHLYLYYDIKGNKEYAKDLNQNELPPIEENNGPESVEIKKAQYYGTTFTNTGAAPAYVNLYLTNFTNSPDVKIGTLQPSLTDKGLSSSVHLKNENKVRIYCQFDANNWNAVGAKWYIVYKTKDGQTNNAQITTHITAGADGSALKATQTEILGTNIANTYYIDLPGTATEFYFATDGNNSGFNTSNNTVTQPWYRTKTITNIHAETGYYLTGVADDTTWNAQYGTFNIPGGISVKTYFDTATINKNQHAYVTLNKGTSYTGASATYLLTAGTNISVNENTGYVTTTNYSGSATITTTITGSLGDTTTVTTAVSNPSTLAGVPVSLNVEVPGTTTNEDNETVNGTAEIVWYIDNSAGSSAVQFGGIYYTK